MNDPATETAIRSALDGREEGYRRLFAAHSATVYRLVQRLAPDAEEAEELTQDAFLRAFDALGNFDARRGAFRSWLLRIAWNVAIDRQRRRRTPEILTGQLADVANVAEDAETPAEEAPRPGTAELMQAVGTLPAEEQTLLTLFYFDEMPQQDIAYITGTTPNAVASRLRRIREKLRKQLEDENR